MNATSGREVARRLIGEEEDWLLWQMQQRVHVQSIDTIIDGEGWRWLHAPSDVPVASAGGLQQPLTLGGKKASFTTGETALLRGFFFGMDKLISAVGIPRYIKLDKFIAFAYAIFRALLEFASKVWLAMAERSSTAYTHFPSKHLER
jgi:hypothetical protein